MVAFGHDARPRSGSILVVGGVVTACRLELGLGQDVNSGPPFEGREKLGIDRHLEQEEGFRAMRPHHAQKAGLRPGDLIVQVFGEDISDWPLNRVVERISGPAGTVVRLTLEDPKTGHKREVSAARASIKIRDVSWQQLPGTDFYHLRLSSFDVGAAKDLRKALLAIQERGAKGIILDLRNNPGGILDEAIDVASQFLGEGDVLLMKDSTGTVSSVPVEKGGVATELPLVALVNGGSASASEILAGSLQDAGRARLLGETTFGTGTVLGQFKLSDGSVLLLAVQEWLTPSGRSFWHKGLTPDEVVTLSPEITPLLPSTEREMSAEQIQTYGDVQLLRALETIQEVERREPGATARAATRK